MMTVNLQQVQGRDSARPRVTIADGARLQICCPVTWTDREIKAFADDASPSLAEGGWVISDGDRAACGLFDGHCHVDLSCELPEGE